MRRCSIVSNSLQPHGLQPTRLLCSWNFPVRLSFPTPGDLLDSGVEPMSPALAGKFTTTVPLGKLKCQRTATITPKSTALVMQCHSVKILLRFPSTYLAGWISLIFFIKVIYCNGRNSEADKRIQVFLNQVLKTLAHL